ncbi:hypothetical protein ACOME3_004389 [Neoechinorhynchus agilis]
MNDNNVGIDPHLWNWTNNALGIEKCTIDLGMRGRIDIGTPSLIRELRDYSRARYTSLKIPLLKSGICRYDELTQLVNAFGNSTKKHETKSFNNIEQYASQVQSIFDVGLRVQCDMPIVNIGLERQNYARATFTARRIPVLRSSIHHHEEISQLCFTDPRCLPIQTSTNNIKKIMEVTFAVNSRITEDQVAYMAKKFHISPNGLRSWFIYRRVKQKWEQRPSRE